MPNTPGAPMFFISYRRDDSSGHVGRLYDALMARFGRQRLFFDIDHIGVGQDFVKVLEDAVTRCSVMLVVMGKRWPGPGRVGARRIDDPGDFVRMEVAAGLRREGLRVVPVLIQGAKMPAPASLPDELKELLRRNAIELSDMRWKEDVARLISGLEDTVISAVPTPAGPLPPWAKWAGIAAVVALLGWGTYGAFTPHSGTALPVTQKASLGTVAQTEIPKGEPPRIPSRLQVAAHDALIDARKWRSDAALTQIEAQLPAAATTADGQQYEVNYAFRSPSDGAGLSVLTGVQGGPRYLKLPAVGKASLRALPDTFVDLPAALAAAQQAGMFGQLRDAKLSIALGGSHNGQPTWMIKPTDSDQFRVYYIDALSGKPLPASAAPKKSGGLIGKIGRLLH